MGISDEEQNNLIHKVLFDDTKQKSEYNRLNVIKFLVNNKVNPDQPNINDITPIHIACLKQYHEIVKYLLSLNVNPNYQDSLGNTPFHYYLNGEIKEYIKTDIQDLIIDDRSPQEKSTNETNMKIEKLIWSLQK